MRIAYEAIGVIRTPHKQVKGMPIQPVGAVGVPGVIEVFEPFREGLEGLGEFSRLMVFYHLHRITGFTLKVKPYLGDTLQGVFATRSPGRPNPIGVSVLTITGVDEARVFVENVDMLDNTPVLDIKPYVPSFDSWDAEKIGWFEGVVQNAGHCKADERFHASGAGG